MRFTVIQSTDRQGNPEYFASGDFKNSEGVYVPYARWLTPSEVKAYLENPDSIDEIMEDYRLTAFKINERVSTSIPNPVVQTASVASTITYTDNITMRQCRSILAKKSLLETVDRLIQAIPGDIGVQARIDWEYATEVSRDYPLFKLLVSELGLTDNAVSELFDQAKKL